NANGARWLTSIAETRLGASKGTIAKKLRHSRPSLRMDRRRTARSQRTKDVVHTGKSTLASAFRKPSEVSQRYRGALPSLVRGGLRLRRPGILALRLYVAVDELDHRHRGVVALAKARLH